MSFADTCTVQAFPVFNGKSNDEISRKSENNTVDVAKFTIDTIIENAVERATQNKASSVEAKNHQEPKESIVTEGIFFPVLKEYYVPPTYMCRGHFH